MELGEKFNLPTRVLDAKTFREELRKGNAPLQEKAVLILSFNYANGLREESTGPALQHGVIMAARVWDTAILQLQETTFILSWVPRCLLRVRLAHSIP